MILGEVITALTTGFVEIVGLTPVYRIVALASGVGKTSLGTEIVAHLTQKGVKLAVVKQTHERILDELSDAGRYWRAGSSTVVVSSPELTLVYHEPFTSLREILSVMKYYPLVIAEGFRGSNIGKAIAIVNDPAEINTLIKEEKGLWYIVSNDMEIVERAKSIGFNALLMYETEQLAGEIFNDAVRLIASQFKGEPEVCGVGSWIELAEKILQGEIHPYECPLESPLRIEVNGKPVILDDRMKRIASSILEAFIMSALELSEKPEKIKIEYKIE